MSDALVELSIEGHIATITINREAKLNAINEQVLLELKAIVAQLRETKDVRCALLTGKGKAFVAGADIAAMKELSPEEAERFATFGQEVFDGLESLRFPVIAVVNGFALGGGCELALACDFIYCSEKAKLGQPEVKLGVIPGFGGTQRLLRRVGVAMAKELVFSGRMIRADEALRIGLANAVFAPEELMAAARKTANEIASMGPAAVGKAKDVMREGADILLRDANAMEARAFGACFSTSDQSEGMAAFLEKRAASFRGE